MDDLETLCSEVTILRPDGSFFSGR